MTSSDNGNKRKVAGGRDARTRTIPSLEIESVRNLYQRTIETGVRPKPGTVQLGPEMLQEHTDAAALVPAPHAEVESESAGGATVARESVLGASRLRREITPVPPDDGLARLIAALDQEILSDEPPLIFPRASPSGSKA